jgi:hypothetical protein
MIERQRCKNCNSIYMLVTARWDTPIIEYPISYCENCFGSYINQQLKEGQGK